MKKSLVATLALAIVLATVTFAVAGSIKHTQKGYLAAVIERDLDLAVNVAMSKDLAALKLLMKTGRVFALKSGVPVQITKHRWSGKVKFRPAGSLIEFWTLTEAIK